MMSMVVVGRDTSIVVGKDVYARSTKSHDKNVEHNDKEHDTHDDGIEAFADLKPVLVLPLVQVELNYEHHSRDYLKCDS